jgi:hypothetical protein
MDNFIASPDVGRAVTADDAVPEPAALTARSMIEYMLPFVRYLMRTGDVVCVG